VVGRESGTSRQSIVDGIVSSGRKRSGGVVRDGAHRNGTGAQPFDRAPAQGVWWRWRHRRVWSGQIVDVWLWRRYRTADCRAVGVWRCAIDVWRHRLRSVAAARCYARRFWWWLWHRIAAGVDHSHQRLRRLWSGATAAQRCVQCFLVWRRSADCRSLGFRRTYQSTVGSSTGIENCLFCCVCALTTLVEEKDYCCRSIVWREAVFGYSDAAKLGSLGNRCASPVVDAQDRCVASTRQTTIEFGSGRVALRLTVAQGRINVGSLQYRVCTFCVITTIVDCGLFF
jgi:hypothetical protein